MKLVSNPPEAVSLRGDLEGFTEDLDQLFAELAHDLRDPLDHLEVQAGEVFDILKIVEKAEESADAISPTEGNVVDMVKLRWKKVLREFGRSATRKSIEVESDAGGTPNLGQFFDAKIKEITHLISDWVESDKGEHFNLMLEDSEVGFRKMKWALLETRQLLEKIMSTSDPDDPTDSSQMMEFGKRLTGIETKITEIETKVESLSNFLQVVMRYATQYVDMSSLSALINELKKVDGILEKAKFLSE